MAVSPKHPPKLTPLASPERQKPPEPKFPEWLNRWCKTHICNALGQMTQGYLTLRHTDGTYFNVGDPTSPFRVTMTILNDDFFTKGLFFGHIGLAESYMDGDWETPSIASVVEWFILNIQTSPLLEGSQNKTLWINAMGLVNKIAHILRANSPQNSQRNIQAHYDLSNDFFAVFLDPTMTYSSGLYTSPQQSLENAQLAKYDALCQKLRLSPSDHVLEIGTGWGGLACYMAKTYGCRVTTITISKEQYEYSRQRIAAEGLQHRIDLKRIDYRHVQGQFDKIVSVEMIEAVGDAYYETFFAQCHALLKPHGLLVLQMITCPDSRFKILKENVDFIQKHIFPGSLLPSLTRVQQALNQTGDLFLHELEDLGNSYALTLHAWYERFNDHLDEVKALGFDERFIRKWNVYFQYCEAAFATRNITVVQAVYTRPNNPTLMAPFWKERAQ